MLATHKSPFSGAWYPDDAAALDSLLSERFAESERRTGPFLFPDALGYVVPHAGPAYSGTVAAAVYRSLAKQHPERIVLLAFPHHGGLREVAVPDVARVATPFGEAVLDSDFAGFPRVPESHVCDHSFEIQLPFLQKSAPASRVTALYVGRMDNAARHAATDKLAAAWRPGTVFIASSDFTHYGQSFGYVPFPADRDVAARLLELDFDCIEAAGSLDSAMRTPAVPPRSRSCWMSYGRSAPTAPTNRSWTTRLRVKSSAIFATR
jgi:MEMO1 family protein